MKEKRDESVEELAAELESRLGSKEESGDLEEIELEDMQEGWLTEEDNSGSFQEDIFSEEDSRGSRLGKEGLEEDSRGPRFGKKSSEKNSRGSRLGKEGLEEDSRGSHFDETVLEEGSFESRRRKDISEDEFLEGDWEEEDWEEEENAPMKPWVMAVIMAGIVVLAAIICAVLWHFTHLEGKDGDKVPSMSASGEDSAADIGDSDDLSGSVPENVPSSVPAPDSENAVPPGVDASASTASPLPTVTPEPVVSPAVTPTAAPQTTAHPGSQASEAVQEPVSGTTAMEFTQSNADVTPKDVVNLRSEPSTLNADNIVAQAKNGEVLSRTGVNEATGWTRLEYNGETLYAVSQYLTTDLTYKPPVQASDPNRVNTMDGRIILFTDCSDNITPKEYVNLRTEPSTSEGESTVRCQISNGEVVHRTGYSPDAGWSRVEYNGEILYVVSSYMYAVE